MWMIRIAMARMGGVLLALLVVALIAPSFAPSIASAAMPPSLGQTGTAAAVAPLASAGAGQASGALPGTLHHAHHAVDGHLAAPAPGARSPEGHACARMAGAALLPAGGSDALDGSAPGGHGDVCELMACCPADRPGAAWSGPAFMALPLGHSVPASAAPVARAPSPDDRPPIPA